MLNRLILNIERLLLTNECVIIPEVGGFVSHPCPAIYIPDQHKFIPPSKAIVFNPTLNHADKLLPQSYIQLYGMSVEEAERSLENDIEALLKILNESGYIQFRFSGVLRKMTDGKLVFEIEQDTSFAGLKPFGLFAFHLPPVAQTARQDNAQTTNGIVQLPSKTGEKRTIYLPVNRKLIRAIGISAAAVGLFLIVSMPLKDTGSKTCPASFTPSEMISQHATDNILQDTAANISVTNEAVAPKVDSSQIKVNEPVAEQKQPPVDVKKDSRQTIKPPSTVKADAPTTSAASASSATPTASASSTTPAASAEKTYYIIIGSFAAEKHALQFMQEINLPELTMMGIVKNEGRARVYAAKFSDRAEAQQYLLRLKETPKIKDAWIYTQ
ncbi:MAG: SPOR domain-containing protein [Tannerella sp.]|jgi:cell division septation protein DedD|nr:SPOR domain-containing protein [Tannerella sp.]